MAAKSELTPESQVTLGVPATYRQALAAVNFPMDALKPLNKVIVWRIWLDFAITAVFLMLVPLLFLVFPNPLTFAFCFILSIRNFNSLAQLIHSSDHGGLFRNPTFNTIAGNCCAFFLGYTRTGHRLAHLNHHLYLNTERDPDRIWGAPDQSSRDVVNSWVQDFLFLSAVKRLMQYSQTDRGTFTASPWKSLNPKFFVRAVIQMLPVIATQCAILALYWLVLGPVYYIALYILPIMTFYPAQIRLRSIVEHAFDAGYEPKTSSDLWITRTTHANLIERFIFSPFGIHYHFEHHLFPGVPHYNLGKVHELLKECNFPVPTAPGYIGFVFGRFRAEKMVLAPGTAS